MRVTLCGSYWVQGNLNDYFLRQSADGRWGENLQLVDEEPELVVIANQLPAQCDVPLRYARCVVIQLEPQSSLSQFGPPFDRPADYERLFAYVHDTRRHYNTVEWQISPSYS